jgi:hypothetical protein
LCALVGNAIVVWRKCPCNILPPKLWTAPARPHLITCQGSAERPTLSQLVKFTHSDNHTRNMPKSILFDFLTLRTRFPLTQTRAPSQQWFLSGTSFPQTPPIEDDIQQSVVPDQRPITSHEASRPHEMSQVASAQSDSGNPPS